MKSRSTWPRRCVAISKTYSGEEGVARLQKDGYEQRMIDKVEGAGTRMIKVGSNLPIHGIVGKFGIYRFVNMLGLVDHHVRGVPPEKARGGRDWNEYTWRGDQAPGHPFVHGLQTSDMDFNDLRFSQAGDPDRQEPDRKQDAGVALAQRSAWSAAASWSTLRRSTTARHRRSNYWISVRPASRIRPCCWA